MAELYLALALGFPFLLAGLALVIAMFSKPPKWPNRRHSYPIDWKPHVATKR